MAKNFLKYIFSIENSNKSKHITVYLFGLKLNFKKKYCDNFNNMYGNKVVFIVDGEEKEDYPIPEGLALGIVGKNNKVTIEMPITFVNTQISVVGDNNVFSIKNTPVMVKDANFYIADGSEVYIDENSSVGQGNFRLVANGNYEDKHKVTIGKNFRAALDTVIRTSDGHTVLDFETNLATNEPKDIIIGDNVWIMTRCMLAKGAKIPSNSAVAAYSFVNKSFDEENILLAGIPAKILKHNFKWDVRSYGQYMRDTKENKEE